MSFKPGDKVVCVDASPTTCLGQRELVEGTVYTVEATGCRFLCSVEYPRAAPLPRPLPCVILREVGGVCCEYFPARRFKPATDISMFHKMLSERERV